MKRLLLAIGVALFAFLPRPAEAAAITLTLQPQVADFDAGDFVDVDVVVGGLGHFMPPSVGAFDLTVAFDAALLVPLDVDFGLLLGDPALFEAITGIDTSVPGFIEFAEVSLLTSQELNDRQPTTFRLATLEFVAVGAGRSTFEFVGDRRVDDEFGLKFTIIAEPPALMLVLFAAAIAARARRRPKSPMH